MATGRGVDDLIRGLRNNLGGSGRKPKSAPAPGKRLNAEARSTAAAKNDAKGIVPYRGQPDAYKRAQQRYESGVAAHVGRSDNMETKSLGSDLYMKANQKNLSSYKPQINKRTKVQTARWV